MLQFNILNSFLFRFALKNNLPVLQHVSLPRVGALQAIVDTVGPKKNINLGGNNNGDSAVNCDGMICVEFGNV
jgi:hypothetical protein